MQYRSSTRLLAAVTAALAVTAGTALAAVPATAAPVTAVRAPAQAAAVITLPHPTEIVSAGATGYLTRAVYPSGTEYRWTQYNDGPTRFLTEPRTTFTGGQSDIVFSRKETESTYWINDMNRTDTGIRYGLSHNDQRYVLRGTAGETLVMSYTDEDTGVLDVNLVSRTTGTTTIRDVTVIPGNARLGRVWASTPGVALIQYSTGTGTGLRTFLVAVDTATGQAVDSPRQTHSEQTGADAFVSRTHWAWIERTTSHRVRLVTTLRGIDAPEVTTDLGQASTGADIDVNLVGNWVTTSELNGGTAPVASALFPLTARSLADPRTTVKLLDHVSSTATAPNGDLYARGGTVALGEGIYHILPGDNGIPVAALVASTEAPTYLALTSTDVPSTVDLDKNGGKVVLGWQLSRQNASGKVTLRHVRTGRTLEFPFENQAGVRREWQGTLADGVPAPNGDYTWQLDAKPLNGVGPDLKKTGTFKVTRAAGLHDYDDNGAPDLLSRDASGRLWRDEVRKTSSSSDYWSLESKLVGPGWNGYDQIEAVGNVAGAPAPDMVARDTSGVLWLYLGKGDGTFAGRTRIGAGWNGYNKITGGSDLNGDGWSDLLATDASGVLWAYQGTGSWSSPFRGRVKVGGGWGAMNQITAVGDIAGTPQGDLLARDTAGVLWLYQGATGSSFAARVRVGSGWGAYTHLVGMGDVDRDGHGDLFAYGKGGSFVYRGTGTAEAPFGPRETSSVYPATPTPRHPIV